MPLSPPVTIATLPASRPKRDFGSGLRSRLARVIIFPETVRNVRKGMNALQRLLVRPRLPLRSIPPPAPMGAGVKALIVEVIRVRSEEHTSELQSLMRISYAVFCLKKKKI